VLFFGLRNRDDNPRPTAVLQLRLVGQAPPGSGIAVTWLAAGIHVSSVCPERYDMWRRIDGTTVADFSSVFALFGARVFHYLLPSHLPQTLNNHLWVGVRESFSDKGGRATWTWLALYFFYRLIKSALFRLFDLNSSTPQASKGPPPDETHGSFVPFDPYDLSKNSPPALRSAEEV
jgi:hypothetical protein